MIYNVRLNKNLHPDVREHLWLRSSGAAQLMKTYEGYYNVLEESPIPPNPSVGTIKADQSRISFDMDVTEKSHKV